jgi:sRNA-binding protein
VSGKATAKNARGYIRLARGVLNHNVIGARQPYTDFEAWIWLLFEAAWKPKRIGVINRNGSHTTITIERGQLSHSLRYIAKAWGWRSTFRVRTFLRRLNADAQISTQTDAGQTVITIRNYGLYQNSTKQADAQTNTQNKRKTNAKHTKKKEREESKESKEKKVSTRAPSARTEATEKEKGVDKVLCLPFADAPPRGDEVRTNHLICEAPEPVNEPPKAKLFRKGKTLLVSLGVPEKRSGSLLGLWLKQKHDPEGILAALQYAVDHGVMEPIAWMTKLLARETSHGKTNPSTSDLAREMAEKAREFERRAAGNGRPADDL